MASLQIQDNAPIKSLPIGRISEERSNSPHDRQQQKEQNCDDGQAHVHTLR